MGVGELVLVVGGAEDVEAAVVEGVSASPLLILWILTIPTRRRRKLIVDLNII